jgi:glycogen operon protein
VNAASEGVEFTLPPSVSAHGWCQVMDTENIDDPFVNMRAGKKVIVGGRAMKLLSDDLFA